MKFYVKGRQFIITEIPLAQKRQAGRVEKHENTNYKIPHFGDTKWYTTE